MLAFCKFVFVNKAGLDVICSLSCFLGEATAGLYVVTERKTEIFFPLYFFVEKP